MKRRTAAEVLIRETVFARDDRCMLAHLLHADICRGHWTVHHRRKASQGGGYSLTNLVLACSAHNDRLEENADFAAAAHTEGLVVRRGDHDWEACG